MSETIGEAFRRLRTARGLSLQQLGKAVPVDKGLLSRIENGRQLPSESLTRAVDAALKADGELVLVKKVNDAATRPAGVASTSVERRTFVTGGAVAVAAAHVLPSAAPTQPGTRVGIADVERIQSCVERLYDMEYRYGGEGLWQAAVGYARDAYALLDHGIYGETVGDKLMGAVGRMQMCSGWLAFDAGAQEVARHAYQEALGLARQAGDAEVETHALANLAFQANVTGNPRQAARWADAANRVASTTQRYALLNIIPHLRLALANAIMGDRPACEQAIARARKILDRDCGGPVARWCAFLTPAELDGIDGTCALELGQAKRAVRLLRSAVDAHSDTYARGRAIYLARLSRAQLGADRDVDAAVATARDAVDARNAVASARLDHELARLSADLRPYSQQSPVKDLLKSISSLN